MCSFFFVVGDKLSIAVGDSGTSPLPRIFIDSGRRLASLGVGGAGIVGGGGNTGGTGSGRLLFLADPLCDMFNCLCDMAESRPGGSGAGMVGGGGNTGGCGRRITTSGVVSNCDKTFCISKTSATFSS